MEQRRQTTRGARISHRGLLLVKLSPIAFIALVIAGFAHAPGVVIGTLAVLMFALYLAGLGSLVAGVSISRGELMVHLRKIAAGDAPRGTAGHHSDSMTAQLQQENREQASTALAEMSSAARRSLKQMGLLVVSAFSFWAVLFSFGITATTSLHDSAGGIMGDAVLPTTGMSPGQTMDYFVTIKSVDGEEFVSEMHTVKIVP